MEDKGERSPQTFLGNNFSSFDRDENKTIGALSSVSFEYRPGSSFNPRLKVLPGL